MKLDTVLCEMCLSDGSDLISSSTPCCCCRSLKPDPVLLKLKSPHRHSVEVLCVCVASAQSQELRSLMKWHHLLLRLNIISLSLWPNVCTDSCFTDCQSHKHTCAYSSYPDLWPLACGRHSVFVDVKVEHLPDWNQPVFACVFTLRRPSSSRSISRLTWGLSQVYCGWKQQNYPRRTAGTSPWQPAVSIPPSGLPSVFHTLFPLSSAPW